jgi:hypothetical protein
MTIRQFTAIVLVSLAVMLIAVTTTLLHAAGHLSAAM